MSDLEKFGKVAERPRWQRLTLERAFELVEGYAGVEEVMDALESVDGAGIDEEEVRATGPMETAIRALMILMADVGAMLKSAATFNPDRPGQKCGWCIAAVGNDQAAWDAAESFDGAGIKAHTLVCPNNPLVQENDRLRAEQKRFVIANAELGDSALNLMMIDKDRLARLIHEELERDDWGKLEVDDFDAGEYAAELRIALERVANRLKAGT